jgi:OmpA-OmpF porin, OOP family
MKKFVLAGSAAIIALAAAASAQPGYYFSGLAGWSIMPDLGLKNSVGKTTIGFDNGYAYGGALGYDMGTGVRLEIDTVHQMSQVKSIGGVSSPGHLYSTSLMANATYDLPSFYTLTPYIGAGAGAQNIGDSVAGYAGNVWRPAYQVEGGLRDEISPNLDLTTEYRFSQAEAAKFNGIADMANQHFSDHLLSVGFTYHLSPGGW